MAQSYLLMASFLSVLLLVASVARAASSKMLETACIGSSSAKHFAVYLHGLDSAEPGPLERANRDVLEKLAKELNLRIAIPRGDSKCGGAVCWGWGLSEIEAENSVSMISAAKAKCIKSGASYGLIGFSNGGYFATKLFRRCELSKKLPNAKWIVTVGSALIKGPLEARVASLKDCGRLTMLVGTKDEHNSDPVQNYFKRLREKQANVKMVEFAGGHELMLNPLMSAVRGYLNAK